MIRLRYASAIAAIEFCWVTTMIAPFTFFLAFMIWMWVGALWWKSALLIDDARSWSILFGRGTLSSLHTIRRHSAWLDPAFRVGPRMVGAVWIWVHRWIVSHLLAGVGVDLGLGLCCGSGCWLSGSFGLGFGRCCRWPFSGSPSCIVPAHCEASRSPPPCLAVSAVPSLPACWVGAASPTPGVASPFTVISVMPVPHCTLSLLHSSHLVSVSSGHCFMPSQYSTCRNVCAASILAIRSIVWCSCITSRACWCRVVSIRLLQCLGALAHFKVSLLCLSHSCYTSTARLQPWRPCMLSSPALRQSHHQPLLLPPCLYLSPLGVIQSRIQ